MVRIKTLQSRIRPIESRIRSVRREGGANVQLYQSATWRRLSAAVSRERGRRCEACGATQGRLAVDHVIPLNNFGAPFDRSNMQLLCGACHATKTAGDAEKLRRGELRDGIHPELLAFQRGVANPGRGPTFV
jgi:5-methylcytosine-specific restriction endonuclease McrA